MCRFVAMSQVYADETTKLLRIPVTGNTMIS